MKIEESLKKYLSIFFKVDDAFSADLFARLFILFKFYTKATAECEDVKVASVSLERVSNCHHSLSTTHRICSLGLLSFARFNVDNDMKIED